MASNLIREPEHPGIKKAREQRILDERMHRHIHNGSYGATVWMLTKIRALMALKSATPKAQELAAQIEPLMIELVDELYTYRIELDGKKVTPEHHHP